MRQMRARGNFRHHAAVRRVILYLRQNLMRAHGPAAVDQRRRRFIATGFNAKDKHGLFLDNFFRYGYFPEKPS